MNVAGIRKDHKFDPTNCKVSKCGTKNCKTYDILNFSLHTILFQATSGNVGLQQKASFLYMYLSVSNGMISLWVELCRRDNAS